MNNTEKIKELIKEKKLILFVGAGVSRNIGLPSFRELIDEVAKLSGFDPDIFKSFSNYQSLVEYYHIQKRGIGELRSFMDRTWHSNEIEEKMKHSEIHSAIFKLDFPIIYTTNYDNWLEKSYEHYKREYTKIVSVKDFLNIKEGKTQIIKFHGDFSSDESIVLTESSYFERMEFSSPLDIKLRSDVIGKSILFIGYSLEDINMRLLIYKLNKMWSGLTDIRPDLFILLSKPNEIEETILLSRGITPIVSDEWDPGEGLKKFLNSLLE